MEDLEDEIVDEVAEELEEVIPSMNVGMPAPEESKPPMVADEAVLGIYGEILNNLREDREEAKDLLANFVEMVINEGDSTTASKEALVNLVKIKQEATDKMTKIADLMTRVKLKERDTFPRYLAAKQENNLYIGENVRDRNLLKKLDKQAKAAKEQK